MLPSGPEDGAVKQRHHEQEDPVNLREKHQLHHLHQDPADQVDEEASGAPDRSQQLGAPHRGRSVEIMQVVTVNENYQ